MNLCSGRLEVQFNQSWSSVCEDAFRQQEAEVVCRELNCGAPLVFSAGLYGDSEAPAWNREFQCGGRESALLDCGSSQQLGKSCSPRKAVGLTCSGRTPVLTQVAPFFLLSLHPSLDFVQTPMKSGWWKEPPAAQVDWSSDTKENGDQWKARPAPGT